ncbi:MAG: hypothetical protein A3K19_12010 [Lentisphaerae bacterium RIFOXYB12_FULL_65_16]|nr:MAG: hypothetical protein A3K18_17485 [Lentisphaerae bacterium RIFOXYA12_64_32]OGV95151.1 MAG: hypothetical protein A3K19_12010 [Lentisphaerae bacterium RIFOXYB12_FULL_65_16]
MKHQLAFSRTTFAATLVGCFLVVAVGCGKEKAAPASADAGQGPEGPATAAASMPVDGFAAGTVVETMDASGYTYVQVDTGKEKIWAAAPQCKVKVGDKVTIPEGNLMSSFHSKTLNRDFEQIYFVGAIGGAEPVAGGTSAAAMPGAMAGIPPGHPPVHGKTDIAGGADLPVTGIEKVEGGQTVAEIYAGKASLAGKSVKVRGKVVKVNTGIMGKNWLHLRDGTGDAGSNDLTVTTAATAQVGDVVVVTGAVTVDKDFGSGYKYAVLIEDGQVAAEKP